MKVLQIYASQTRDDVKYNAGMNNHAWIVPVQFNPLHSIYHPPYFEGKEPCRLANTQTGDKQVSNLYKGVSRNFSLLETIGNSVNLYTMNY